MKELILGFLKSAHEKGIIKLTTVKGGYKVVFDVEVKEEVTEVVKTPTGHQEFVELYYSLFEQTYGSKPLWSGKEYAATKRLLKDYGIEILKELLPVYFKMTDYWLIKYRHSLTLFMSHINAVKIKSETGRSFSNSEIKQIETTNNINDQLARLGIFSDGQEFKWDNENYHS